MSPQDAARPRWAFTLVEAMIAIAIVAMAGSALLLGVHSSLQTTDYGMEQTMALGMAQQLLDEVLGAAYCADPADPYQTTLCPNAWEAAGAARERFNDIDDYAGFRRTPAVDAWGVALGSDDGEGGKRHANFCAPSRLLERWRQEIDVYYVSPSDLATRLPAGQVSDFRAVEVRILLDTPDRGRRELAKVRQVVAYVPPSD